MSRLVTSSQCASQQNKRGLCPVFPAVLAGAAERKSAQRLMYPFGFQFNSAFLFTYSNFPVWAFIRRKTFWFVLPTLYLYYCLEWKHSVSSCRISGDLAPHSKSLTLFKMYCFHKDACAQPLSSLSSFSLLPSLHCLSPSLPPSPALSFPLAYISICPLAGLGEKGLHEQALCHSGRVHQRAECTGWSGLLWREDKEVSRKPAPRHPARSALHVPVFFLRCQVAPLPLVSLTEFNSALLSGITASVTPNPERQTHRLSVFMSTTISLNPAWPLNWIIHILD